MQIVPLGPGFAAELRGVALGEVAADDAAYRDVRAAFEEHSVLVFRDQTVSDGGQVAFSRRFGPLETVKVGSLGEGSPFSVLTNIDPAGGVVPADHRQALVARANQLWHTDSSFKATPALASVLSARVIPPSGGETEFASTRLAWERLDPTLRSRLANAVAWHDYGHSRGRISPELMTPAERAALPPVRWRMAWRNPANDRTALYVASHAFTIDGMPPDEAQALLARLIDEATLPELTYLHRWRAGDVVMWDNRATMHRGRPWPADLPRHMVRTTISATDADGLAGVRPAA
jgi:alpha-ketoglutarate-dependent 2,4-dichlorophenoxyacetate dioxygenase